MQKHIKFYELYLKVYYFTILQLLQFIYSGNNKHNRTYICMYLFSMQFFMFINKMILKKILKVCDFEDWPSTII